MDDGKIVGLLLDYLGHTGFHFIWLWGYEKVCDKLLDAPLPEKMIFCVSPELESIIESRFAITAKYSVDFMLLEKGNERLYLRHRIKGLGLEDAYSLACLRKEKPSKKEVEEAESFIKEQPFYGIFKNSKLVSVACIQVKLPEIWMLGGFYTHPEHRNHGYATSLASFLAKKALKETNYAGLHVRSDNYPAKRLYEKIGFKENKTLYWLDFRTGLIP
jgi:GNAT superfamily N-acetyltransferase